MGESLTGGRTFGFLFVPHLVTSGRKSSIVYMGSWVQREEKLEMKDPFALLGTTGRFGQTRVACSRIGSLGGPRCRAQHDRVKSWSSQGNREEGEKRGDGMG